MINIDALFYEMPRNRGFNIIALSQIFKAEYDTEYQRSIRTLQRPYLPSLSFTDDDLLSEISLGVQLIIRFWNFCIHSKIYVYIYYNNCIDSFFVYISEKRQESPWVYIEGKSANSNVTWNNVIDVSGTTSLSCFQSMRTRIHYVCVDLTIRFGNMSCTLVKMSIKDITSFIMLFSLQRMHSNVFEKKGDGKNGLKIRVYASTEKERNQVSERVLDGKPVANALWKSLMIR